MLSEAGNQTNPLLERVRFLAIASSNLDGFFMKRIGGLKQQVCAGVREPSADGLLPREQLAECLIRIGTFEELRERIWNELAEQLARQKISILKFSSLPADTKTELKKHFKDTIYPLITPQSIDPAHPFPFISNLSLNLLVSLCYHTYGETTLARIKIPVEDPNLQRELDMLLETYLRDNTTAWDMDGDGRYVKRRPDSETNIRGSQEMLGVLAQKRAVTCRRSRKKYHEQPKMSDLGLSVKLQRVASTAGRNFTCYLFATEQ